MTMNKLLTMVAIVLGALILMYCTVSSIEKQDAKVLVFSKTNGFRHESIPDGIRAIQQLGQQHGFTVETSEDSTVMNEDYLKDFNVIVFLNTTGNILNEQQQHEVERFVQAGGGFVGVHAAADTEYEWPWYGRLVGAYFNGHPGNPNVREGTLVVVDPDHPATDSLPTRWTREDEWYNYKEINPDNNDLIQIDESTYEGGTNGEDHPMSWYKEYDGGRAFYTGLGHTKETYTEPLYLDHLWGGIQYALGEGAPVDYAKASQK